MLNLLHPQAIKNLTGDKFDWAAKFRGMLEDNATTLKSFVSILHESLAEEKATLDKDPGT